MEKSGFFNSSDGDRIYDATDFAAYFGSLVSNGVFYAAATNLQATPMAPALTRTSDVYEIGIADMLIPAAATLIAANNITDTRLNTSLCGLVNSLITAVYE
ncbi:MAG: hypothetical protein ABF904_03040 [Ethanoligenens sp.]